VNRRTVPGDADSATAPDTSSISKELWYPTPGHANVSPAPKPRLSTLTWLLLIALIGSHAGVLSSTAHHAALASALLLVTFVALARSSYALMRYAITAVRRRREGTDR
jgi:hypothetical protein